MGSYLVTDKKKITAQTFRSMKATGEKISMLTSYDFTLAGIVDEAGIDGILVGDSASNVMQGNETTLPITVDEMIVYAKGVKRAAKRALVVCDMPFGSYQASTERAMANGIKIMKETGVDALKLEGGREIVAAVKALVAAGIPVMGHLGLTPQSIHRFGGYGLRAKDDDEARRLVEDAQMLCQAGCFAIVLEKIPALLAKKVTKAVQCPTIGIGAGNGTDGQILVVHDMLGMSAGFKPKFLRKYADTRSIISNAIGQYVADVKAGEFPNDEESY